jgi:hypothetical protein
MINDTPVISDEFRQRVLEAAARLRSRGETASIRLVRAEMGGGSPNWIAIVLREQRATDERQETSPETPEVAAAKLLIPGLLEQLRATIADEFADRLANMQLDVEESQKRLREQTFAMLDIEKENEALRAGVETLELQLADRHDLLAAMTSLAVDVKAIHAAQSTSAEQTIGALQAARKNQLDTIDLLRDQIPAQAEVKTNIEVVRHSITELATQQSSSERTLIVGIDRVIEHVDKTSRREAATIRSFARTASNIYHRLENMTRMSKRTTIQKKSRQKPETQ